MKIGIFGGSFNPPHNMHKKIALDLIKNGYLDKVIYVPTGDSYVKKDLIGFKDRYNMVELMIRDDDNLNVSDIGNSDKHQYTYQVLDYFSGIYPNDDIYFICGSDNLDELYTWKRYEYILDNYRLLVIKRNTDNIEIILSRYDKYFDKIIISGIETSWLSSTYLRSIADSEQIENYVDDDVYDYIVENNLYVSKNNGLVLQLKK